MSRWAVRCKACQATKELVLPPTLGPWVYGFAYSKKAFATAMEKVADYVYCERCYADVAANINSYVRGDRRFAFLFSRKVRRK